MSILGGIFKSQVCEFSESTRNIYELSWVVTVLKTRVHVYNDPYPEFEEQSQFEHNQLRFFIEVIEACMKKTVF